MYSWDCNCAFWMDRARLLILERFRGRKWNAESLVERGMFGVGFKWDRQVGQSSGTEQWDSDEEDFRTRRGFDTRYKSNLIMVLFQRHPVSDSRFHYVHREAKKITRQLFHRSTTRVGASHSPIIPTFIIKVQSSSHTPSLRAIPYLFTSFASVHKPW